MNNLDQDPEVLVSEERAKLFAPIQDRLELLISESNTPPKIEFENNSISQKTTEPLSSQAHLIFQSERLLPQIL